jgi:P2 family phage contractile tail tube protein
MNIQVNALVNAAVYLLPAGLPQGATIAAGIGSLGGLLGRAAEVELPHPKSKMVDYKGLGMIGDLELWAGIDKLESTIKWASYDPTVLTQIVNPLAARYVQVMGNVTQYTSGGVAAQIPVVYIMGGVFRDPGTASVKKMEQSEMTSHVTIYHAEEYIGGVQTFLYDVFSNTYIVGGVDILAQYRQNLGG